MIKTPFRSAGFRHKSLGHIVETGQYHNIEPWMIGGSVYGKYLASPAESPDWEAGFVTHDGCFLNREEAAKRVALSGELDSSDNESGLRGTMAEELSKKESDRQEYSYLPPVKSGNEYHLIVKHTPTNKTVGKLVLSANPQNGYHAVKDAEVSMLHQRKGIYGNLLTSASKFAKQVGSKGIVSLGEWRSESATGAWKKFAQRNKGVVSSRGKEADAPDFRFSEQDSLQKTDDENIRHYYLSEGCPHFALAMHRRFKHPIRMLVGTDGTIAHVFNSDPKTGEALDVMGRRSEKEIKDYYHDVPNSRIVHVGEEKNLKQYMGPDQPLYDHSEDEIKEAMPHVERIHGGLEKMQSVPKLPNLGFNDDRRETPIVTTPEQREVKVRAIANASSLSDNKVPPAQQVPGAGATSPNPKMSVSYAAGNELRANTKRGQDPKAPIATVQHENAHMFFNRVAAKHGVKAKRTLLHNLWNSIDPEDKKAVQDFVSHKYAGKEPIRWHEEHIANLLNYLNSPIERELYHKAKGFDTGKESPIDIRMKRAFRAVQKASKVADKHWLKRVIPSEHVPSIIKKSEDWKPSLEEIEHAHDLLNASTYNIPEFRAAKFMANQYTPTQEDIDAALMEHEGDHLASALMAHKIPVTHETVALLQKIMEMQDFKKAEFEVAALPRKVVPFNDEAIPVAEAVQEAFIDKKVTPISLNGKHSSGTAIVKIDGQPWLLKPGSGALSPALGVSEEKASQSRREVVFNVIARLMGLGHYVPKAALLIIDGKEVAALEFFSNDYKPLGKIQKDSNISLKDTFQRFVGNGLLYKWAAMDYLLGQADRHSGNIMADDGGNVRFIDAGSAFAGPSFNPSADLKSFIPFYLRVFSGRKFKALTPKERYESMPSISTEADYALKFWLDSLPEGQIVATCNQFGISPQPIVDRLKALRDYPGPKNECLRRFFSGLM